MLEQLSMDTAVPVTGLVLLEDLPDRSLNLCLRVWALEAGLMIEKRRTGQARYAQQQFQPVFGLESDNGAYLYGRSPSPKARTFPRNATSARSRSFSRRSRCSSDSGFLAAPGSFFGRPFGFGRSPSSPAVRY